MPLRGIHARPEDFAVNGIEDGQFAIAATNGVETAEPSTTHRKTGFVAAEKPSYKEVNWQWQLMHKWLRRARAVGFFVPSYQVLINITATGAVGFVRTYTLGGQTVSVTTMLGDTVDTIAERLAEGMVNNAEWRGRFDVLYYSDHVTILSRTPAQDDPITVVDVNATVVESVKAPYQVRLSDDDMQSGRVGNLDFVFGSLSKDAQGATDYDARFFFDKAKRAFRAGLCTSVAWDQASLGLCSVAMGSECEASGDFSIAIGGSCSALGDYSVALGGGASASQVNAVAIGVAEADGQDALALGQAAAIGVSAVAIGGGNLDKAEATADNAVAVGAGAQASAARAIAVGKGALASDTDALAIGTGVESDAEGALATGKGYPGSNGRVFANGKGARAHGCPDNAAGHDVVADGINAVAEGDGSVATPNRSRALGVWAVPTMQGEWAHAGNQIGALGAGHVQTQYGTIHVMAETVGAVTVDLTDMSAAVAWTPADNCVYQVRVQAVAKRAASADVESWEFWLALKKIGGAITFAGAGVNKIAEQLIQGGTVTTDKAVALGQLWGSAANLKFNDDGAGSFQLIAIGVAGQTWHWAARIEYVRVGTF